MRMRIKILVVVFIGFAIGVASCKKEKGTEIIRVNGMLVDANTNAPVSNYNLQLIEEGYEDQDFHISGSKIAKLVRKEATTNANGYFDFGLIEMKKSSNYYYYVKDQLIIKGIDNNMFLKLYAMDQFRVNFIPAPPYPINDSMVVNLTHSIFTNNKYKITNLNYYQGNYPRYVDGPTGEWYITIQKYKSGIYTTQSDTFNLIYRDTTNYDVNF